MRLIYRNRIYILLIISLLFQIYIYSADEQINKNLKSLNNYMAIGWNDLGMHCMNKTYDALCVLPPYNNLWIQVLKRDTKPSLVSKDVILEYSFPANTYSVGKINFWSHVNSLFGVTLQNNIGLSGNGLSGTLIWNGTAYEATGVPITPFDDATPTIEQPYQLAEIILKDLNTQQELDRTSFVVPTSTEMHCELCHSGGGNAVEINILKKHDEENNTSLFNSKPILCAKCHASNALGTTGDPELPNLSLAMHEKHKSIDTGCYKCHPGAQTQCFRGAMFLGGKTCKDCHGNMTQVATSIKNGRKPWIDEPKCATCHPAYPENTGKLYRNSIGHGGLYCTACHNSPHAELPTGQSRDAVQVLRLQGKSTYIKNCLVCHTSQPLGAGPHNVITSWRIIQHLLGTFPMTAELIALADYNGSGGIDIGDVIHQVLKGL